jgi:hypothetical protein
MSILLSDHQTSRRFFLYRFEDATGLGGLGVVADGVQFPDGTVALRWRGYYPSTAIYENWMAVEHLHCHDGKSKIAWVDPDETASK